MGSAEQQKIRHVRLRAVAIAYRAIQSGFEARFTTADQLIGDLSAAAQSGTLDDALEPHLHPHVLVNDELGYQSFAADAANVVFRVVSQRHLRRRPILVTTNKPLAALGQVLHDGDLAEAILDRLLEGGTHYVLRGRSYRTRPLKEDTRAEPAEDAAWLSPLATTLRETPRQNSENPQWTRVATPLLVTGYAPRSHRKRCRTRTMPARGRAARGDAADDLERGRARSWATSCGAPGCSFLRPPS